MKNSARRGRYRRYFICHVIYIYASAIVNFTVLIILKTTRNAIFFSDAFPDVGSSVCVTVKTPFVTTLWRFLHAAEACLSNTSMLFKSHGNFERML